MYDVAKEHAENGLFPIPVQVEKDDCHIVAKWQSVSDYTELEDLFNRQNGIAVVCGKRSDNLQIIDVDQKHDQSCTLSGRFMEALKYTFPDIYDSFYIEETRSGGIHVFFRRSGEVGSKLFPAKTVDVDSDGKEKEVDLIEVLGEGNIVFTNPTPLYTIKQGSKDEIPVLSDNEFELMISTCEIFNEIPRESVAVTDYEYSDDTDQNDMRPGTLFNRSCDPAKFASYLCSRGWKVFKKIGDKYWLTRPGKQSGVSATWNHDGKRLLCVFSSSTDFETHRNGELRGHTPFSVFTKLSHNGDFRAATAELVENGFVKLDDWDEIEKMELEKAPPFDLESMFPQNCGMLREYIQQVATTFQVHPEMVVLPLMSTISLALCSAAKLKVRDDWCEDAPINTVVVAEASERKSPVLKEVLAPMKTYFAEFGKEHYKQIASIARKRRGLDAALEAAEQKYEKFVSTGKSVEQIDYEITDLQDQIMNTPPVCDLPDLLVSDTTPEALVRQLDTNMGTCGVISSESEPIEIALGLYSDKANVTVYLKGYSVEEYSHNRVSGGKIVIPEPRVVLGVMMQREPMTMLTKSRQANGRGFIARILYAVPQSKLGYRQLEPAPIDPMMRKWWETNIHRILDLPHKNRLMRCREGVRVCTDEPAVVELSSEAYDIFHQAREANELALRSGECHDDGAGWGGKIMGNIARIALSLHFIGGGTAEEPVSVETMQSACNWIEPLTAHYYIANGEVGGAGMDRKVLNVIQKMLKKEVKDGESMNSVYKKLRTRSMNKATDFNPIWERMTELGYIRVVKGEKQSRGAAKKVIRLHPNFSQLA